MGAGQWRSPVPTTFTDHGPADKTTTSAWTDSGVQATLRKTASDRVGDRVGRSRRFAGRNVVEMTTWWAMLDLNQRPPLVREAPSPMRIGGATRLVRTVVDGEEASNRVTAGRRRLAPTTAGPPPHHAGGRSPSAPFSSSDCGREPPGSCPRICPRDVLKLPVNGLRQVITNAGRMWPLCRDYVGFEPDDCDV